MCGIAGIFSYGLSAPPVDQGELLRIRDSMARRGPDGAGLWIDERQRVGLAHRRLAIIDTGQSGAQPMASADGRLRITFNGEIYNYRELRRGLEARGNVFRTGSDTEVLLQLYADRGEDMVYALQGMYAFALWDAGKQALFLARDPFGIKPLYYSDNGSAFRFGSQVKALASGGSIDCHPDAAGYAGFLLWGCVPDPFTLHREISALPAGSRMWVGAKGPGAPAPFFSIREEFLRAQAARGVAGPGDGARQALDALRASVGRHLVADVPVAAFLSAGLDSGTLASLACGQAGGGLRTLTLGFNEQKGGEFDETGLASRLAGRLGVAHETRWSTRMEFESDLDEILRAMDQPSTDGVNTYLVSKAAARSGMKVALSGLGGDELLAGYPSFRDVPRIRRLCAAVPVSGAAGVLLRRAVAPLLSRFTSPKYASLLEYGSSDGGAYLLRRGLFMPWELPQVLDAQFAAQGLERLQSLARLGECCAGLAGGRPVVSTLELSWYMRNQLLRDSDWAGMAHSLEIRLPYLDLEFFRAALGAAAAGQPLGKADLAGQLDPPLPAEILLRRKTGFLAPVREWCTDPAREGNTDRGLRGWARIVLGNSLGASGVAATSSGARPVHFGSAWRRKADREAMVQAAEFKSRQPRGRRLLRRTQASLAKAAFAATNATLRAAARSLWPRPRPSDAEQVCIFRIGNIGDIVCALPAIASVRRAYPRARLTLLTSPGRKGLPGAAEVLAGSDSVDDLWVYHAEDIDTFGKRRMLLRGLRARRFDVWIDLPNNRTTVSRQLRDMAVAWMVRARWARGWCIDSLDWAAQAQSEYLPFSNEVERTMDIVRRSGFDAGAVSFGLGVAPGARERVEALFREHGIAPGHLVAIAPGAKRSTNLWDIGRFAEVGRELSALGHTVLVLGGESEAGACRRLAEQIGPAARTFAGELSVVESCAVLRCCSVLVCLDSGVQHMAAAVGTPCVSLFSFWQMPGKWHPFGDRNIVIRKWVSCHTCMLDECPNGNLCMNEIGVGEVMRHATEILGSGAPRPVAAA